MLETFFRKANVTSAEAISALSERYPKSELVTFETKEADANEARSARVKKGEKIYAATLKLAEFPPEDDNSDTTAPHSPEPDKPVGDDGGDDSPPDDSGDDSPDDVGGPPAFDSKEDDGGGNEGEHKEKKMAPAEETNHLLRQILDAVKGGASLDGPDLPPPGPPAGAGGPPPGLGAGGPPGGPPGAGKPPLPPLVPPKAPAGVGAFSHYNPNSTQITTVRKNANKDTNKVIVDEAHEVYPTHKVAKIQRTGSAILNGRKVNLEPNNLAVVTLVKR